MSYRRTVRAAAAPHSIFRSPRAHSVAIRRTPTPHETEKAPSNARPRRSPRNGPGYFVRKVLVSLPGFVFTGGRTDFTPHPERYDMYVVGVSG